MSKDSQELNLGPIGDKLTAKVKKEKVKAGKSPKGTKAIKVKPQTEIPALPISEPLSDIAPAPDLLKETVTSAHPAAALPAKAPSKAPATAKDLTLDGYADERVAACIATFADGYAAGWFFALPEAFKESLDIQMSQRVFKGKTQNILTQGKLFSFSQGDVFYDTKEAYTDKTWREQAPKVSLCIQVKDAIPAKFAKTKEYETADSVRIFEDKSKQDGEKKPKKDSYNIKFARYQIDFGFVRLAVLAPNNDCNLTLLDTYETDQEMFVRFLQTGLLRCNDGKEHDFNGHLKQFEPAGI